MLDPSRTKGVFTPEEDELIFAAVDRHGESSWAKVASYIQGRDDGMVRRRWHYLQGELISHDISFSL